MDVVLKSLTQYSEQILLLLVLTNLGVLLFLARLWSKQSKHQARWRELLQGARGDNLETLLYDHLRERMRLETDLEQLRQRLNVLEDKMTTTKRHMGLVRYDAFEDVGGVQSFALALYDDRGSGALLNGVVGRNDCRVYCKPLLNGQSERTLSQEEQRAIREARSDAPKTIVSP